MEETWKPINGYKGLYEVSNSGRVKSLKRVIINSIGHKLSVKEKILKPFPNKRGYHIIGLSKGNKLSRYSLSLLVWDYFGYDKRNGRELQVDHIDANKKNNNITNLQLLTNQDNIIKGHQERGKLLPPGISYYKSRNKYRSYYMRNKKFIHTGYFATIEEAKNSLIINIK